MPYSPLYRSIKLILSSALGLTVCSTAMAASPTPSPQSTLPLTSTSFEEQPIMTSDDPVGPIKIGLLEDETVEDHTLNKDHSNTIVSSIDTDADTASTEKQAAANKALTSPDDDESQIGLQKSLERLAQFYDLKPETERPSKGLTLGKFLHPTKAALSTSTISTTVVNSGNHSVSNSIINESGIDKSGSDSKFGTDIKSDTIISPIIPLADNEYNIDGSTHSNIDNSVDNNPRCDGRWVYPKGTANLPSSELATGPTSLSANGQDTLYAQADYGYYDNVNYAELSGNVIIDQGPQHIEADKITLDTERGVAAAQGQVLFTDSANVANRGAKTPETGSLSTGAKAQNGGIIGVADSLAYDTASGQSTAKDVAFASVPLQAHGYAKKLNRPSETKFELDDVMFTTCPPTNRKWHIDAKTIDIDTESGRGVARDTTFKIAEVPVLYLPYFNFPIDARRSSGFLLPNIGIGSESGVEVDVPYYFNLAPNYDATLNTHIYTNRNPMLSGEFRYLTDGYGSGQLTASYLPSDQKYDDKDRSSIFYDHLWDSEAIPRLSGDITYNYVSDADYLSDFDTLGLSNNTLNLPRRARLNYYNDYINGELKVESYQSLNAFNNAGQAIKDKDKPYAKLPQLNLNYRLPWSDIIDITGVHDSAYFKKSIDDGSEAEKSGVRIYNKISAGYPLEKSWGYIKPQVSLQHLFTTYDQDSLDDNQLDKKDGSQSVFVPQMTVDAGLHFYQAGSPFGWYDDSLGGYQLLSPRVKYSYAPYRDQNNLPNFNTRIASINYQQLYADSWFLGHDRLQDLNAITPGLNYRYIDAMGVTRFDGSIAEQFYFDDGQVTLDNTKGVFTNGSSGMVWEASMQPYHRFWVDVSGALTNDYDLNYITTELRYQPTEDSLFNVGYVKRRRDINTNQLPLTALTASTIFPINNNWRLLGQGQYDLENNRMLDALVGVDYEDCCFGFALYGRRYYNDLNISDDPYQAVMAEIRLNGFGNSGGRLSRLLSDKILGFEPVQDAWK